MKKSVLEIAGFDPADPEIIAAGEDFEEYANLVAALYASRKALGITQKAVAAEMGTQQSAVSDIERVGGNPTIRTLQAYSRAVGLRLRLRAIIVVSPGGWNSAGSFPTRAEVGFGPAVSPTSPFERIA